MEFLDFDFLTMVPSLFHFLKLFLNLFLCHIHFLHILILLKFVFQILNVILDLLLKCNVEKQMNLKCSGLRLQMRNLLLDILFSLNVLLFYLTNIMLNYKKEDNDVIYCHENLYLAQLRQFLIVINLDFFEFHKVLNNTMFALLIYDYSNLKHLLIVL